VAASARGSCYADDLAVIVDAQSPVVIVAPAGKRGELDECAMLNKTANSNMAMAPEIAGDLAVVVDARA